MTIVALAAFISPYSSTTQTLISAKVPCQEQVLEGQGTTNEESGETHRDLARELRGSLSEMLANRCLEELGDKCLSCLWLLRQC